uniref:Uncharacterized protein n=1 Tax=Pseudellipsoidion edaphicum TaxID=1431838 RepID=A0A3R5QMP0_9STRA|nr:hypothetical protein Ycf19 [Pseudellipsoidion edaphicum]QAA11993.1 hypothetical protein Ycf19 [Pseudellipsoidion edaphicum]
MSYFFYKYLLVKALIKRKTKSLYFKRFILTLYKYVPFLLKFCEIFFRFFMMLDSFIISKLVFKVLLVALYHSIIAYQIICSIRIFVDYYSINLDETNSFLRTIYDMSEPFFEFIQQTLPKSAISSILGFYTIYVATFLIKKVYLPIRKKYYMNSTILILADTLILLRATRDEKIIFN